MIDVIRTYTDVELDAQAWYSKVNEFMAEVFTLAGVNSFGNLTVSTGSSGESPAINITCDGQTVNVWRGTASYKANIDGSSSGTGTMFNAYGYGTTLELSTRIYGVSNQCVLIKAQDMGVADNWSGLLFLNINNGAGTFGGYMQTSGVANPNIYGISNYSSNTVLNTFSFPPATIVNSAKYDSEANSAVVLFPYIPAKCNGHIIPTMFVSKYHNFSTSGQSYEANEGAFTVNGHHFITTWAPVVSTDGNVVVMLSIEDTLTDGTGGN